MHRFLIAVSAFHIVHSDCGCAGNRGSSGIFYDDEVCNSRNVTPEHITRLLKNIKNSDYKHLSDVVLIPEGKSLLGNEVNIFPSDAEPPQFNYSVETPFWMDKYEVSNYRFAKFVQETGFMSESEKFGWSFVPEMAVPVDILSNITEAVQNAEWWVPVPNASWYKPEGILSDISTRMNHPALHLSKRDADAFCAWHGGRLPFENEWEYASRGGKHARVFPWGNARLPSELFEDSAEEFEKESEKNLNFKSDLIARLSGDNAQLSSSKKAKQLSFRANIWEGRFPSYNLELDGYTWASPVDAFGPQNAYGLYGMVGNVWEWTQSGWCPSINVTDGSLIDVVSFFAVEENSSASLNFEGSVTVGEQAKKRRNAHLYRPLVPPECRHVRNKLQVYKDDPGEIDFVKKGGSFMCHRSFCYRYRCSARDKNSANSAAYNLGFRCVYDTLDKKKD